jgi:predicted nucleotidyltransferase
VDEMKKHHQELLDTILQVIKTDYADDISIMFIYGSCVNGTANDKSDLDMIFIPNTEKGWKLAKTFIYNDCGNDLWGTSWERIERFANFDDMKVSVIADSQLVYYATEDDRQRYEMVKKRAYDIKNGELTPDLIHKAETHLEKAKQYFGELCLSEDLICAGGILYEISDVTCLLNHTFLHFGIKRMIDEMSAFEKLPEGFISAFKAVTNVSTIEQVKTSCYNLINMVGNFLKQMKNETIEPIPFSDLAGLYEEISAHWNKIYLCCEENNAMTALMVSASLQHELDNVQNRLGISIDDLQFINSFNAYKLNEFALAAEKAQRAFIELLQNNEVPIVKFDSLSQLKMFLSE